MNLTSQEEYEYICSNKDETGEIARAAINLRNQLRQIETELRNGADTVLDGSRNKQFVKGNTRGYAGCGGSNRGISSRYI